VFDRGADDAGGALGPQRDRSLPAIFKRVGFFVDDVARLTDSAVEELAVLEDRCADFLEVIELGHFARDALDRLPIPSLTWKDVLCAFGGLNLLHV
jgi:hypothetical protein